jgi:molybdopterin converting factor small subunit
MDINVKLFGPEAHVAGQRQIIVQADEPVTCRSLAEQIGRQHPRLAAALPRCRFAVNHEFARPEDPIRAGDEVALIGQVSGG